MRSFMIPERIFQTVVKLSRGRAFAIGPWGVTCWEGRNSPLQIHPQKVPLGGYSCKNLLDLGGSPLQAYRTKVFVFQKVPVGSRGASLVQCVLNIPHRDRDWGNDDGFPLQKLTYLLSFHVPWGGQMALSELIYSYGTQQICRGNYPRYVPGFNSNVSCLLTDNTMLSF